MTAPVSIVIPVLNEIETLQHLFRGLECQTLRPKEIIFVDAGSLDGSREVISEWWKIRGWEGTACRIIRRNGALPGAARNAGIEEAGEEWVAFLDAGIVPEPDWLYRLLIFAGEKNANGVFGVCRFEGSGTIGRAVCALSYGHGAVRPVLPASLFRRNVFGDTGLFRTDLRAGEDVLWMKSFIAHYPPKYVCGNAVVHYWKFPESASAAARKWYVYGINAALADLFVRQQRVYFLFFGLLSFIFLFSVALGIIAAALYVLMRSVIVPALRASSVCWWKGEPAALLMTFFLGPLLDASKVCGFLTGHLMKYKR